MTDEKLKKFIDFIGSTKAKVYYYLFSNIIKTDCLEHDSDDKSWEYFHNQYVLHDLYHTFYKKGYLLAWSYQKDIADFIGCSKTTVSKCLKQLEKDKSIEIIKHTVHDNYEGNTNVTLYLIGAWRIDEEDNYVEYIGINNKFGEFDEETLLQKSLHAQYQNTITCPAFFGGIAKVITK